MDCLKTTSSLLFRYGSHFLAWCWKKSNGPFFAACQVVSRNLGVELWKAQILRDSNTTTYQQNGSSLNLEHSTFDKAIHICFVTRESMNLYWTSKVSPGIPGLHLHFPGISRHFPGISCNSPGLSPHLLGFYHILRGLLCCLLLCIAREWS